ncbi:Uncharacterized protein GBIM_04083 [Gryllus bimaculatus]|nr:Uncharacterized protein GBIM_04083 [Gryllus bimaculatus]
MLKSKETDNVSEGVIREIITDCASKGVTVDEALAAYVIKLTVLDPAHGFIQDQPLGTEDLCKLVALCIEKLLKENCPYLSTIKMQVEFQTHHRTRKQQVAEIEASIKKSTGPLLREITDASSKYKDDLEKLYKKIIAAIILRSGLGNPTNIGVMKEATAALQSVFPPSELGQFLALTRREKEQQVYELTQIVTGIRLFNRDCQKGGEGIDDLPHILDEANHATQEALKTYLHKIMQQIDTLTTTLEIHLHKQNEDNTAESQGEEEDYIEVPDEEIIFLKGCLIAARQQEIYTRKLLAEVVSSEGILQELLDHLTKRLVQLHDTVRFRTAIPTVEVYVLDLIDMDIVKYLIGNRQILTDVDRLSNKPGLSISGKLDTSCEHISPSAANFNDFSPQYLGFCAWAVVAGEGILIPGNLNIGLIRWNDNYYACSTAEAAVLFGQNPERFVTDALNLARRIPELVELLQLQDQLAQQKDIREKVGKEILAVKQDTGMQTVLHPIPPCTDNKYTWNVWKLKRRAIQLTNIANSATHSTQTIKSHFRSEVPLQAGPSKEKSCQTKKDSSTNVPTLGSFIFGLRGRRDDKQFKIHLTRPVDE